MGDVILTTALIDRMLAVYGNDVAIDVATGMPHVYTGMPHVRTVNPVDLHYADYDRVIDLDGAYEANRSVHAIDAYMIVAFGDANWPRKETVLRRDVPRLTATVDWRRAIVLHAGIRDRNRSMPRLFWETLVALLLRGGYVPVLVGTSEDHRWPERLDIVDLCGDYTVQETAWMIAQAACFFSLDTGVGHIAGTTDTPMVTLFTSVRPQNRMRWRHGVLGWRVTPLVPELDCVGCHSGPCPLGHYGCTEGPKAVTAETVYAAIVRSVETAHGEAAQGHTAPLAEAAQLTFIGSCDDSGSAA
ncbi:MAG: glycosyltransferase family 9 protein [Acetobacteraceae bacterium]